MADKWNNFEQIPVETPFDIELLQREVGQRFPFYDMKSNINTVAFFCRIDEETLEEKFESLRLILSEKHYIPMIRFEHGEYIIYVIKKQLRKKTRSVWINIILLIATAITVTLTGSLLYIGYIDMWTIQNKLDIIKPENILNGIILFALPLMSILFIHEMGHYYISRKHRIATSLPFFLPIPPILPGFNIGTFGALISTREPMPNKKALFDIGIAGPVAGFLIALPVTIIGIATSPLISLNTIPNGQPILGNSLLFMGLTNILRTVPSGYVLNLNLIAFAGWVGLLITSINLLPASQLDGGHIFRSVLGEKQKWAGWIAVIIMVFTGWIFFALIIVFAMGMAHPPPLNDITKLDQKRKLLFFVALVMLIICFIPDPFYFT